MTHQFYLYRLLSGNNQMADRLLRAMRWFALYNTFQDILPGLARFSRQEPFFATLAENIFEKTAMLENGVQPRAAPHPAWYTTHLQLYDRDDVQSALISRLRAGHHHRTPQNSVDTLRLHPGLDGGGLRRSARW